MTIKKAELRTALEAIANSFEGVWQEGTKEELSRLAFHSLKIACEALHWKTETDSYGNIKLVRSDLIETTKDNAIDDAFQRVHIDGPIRPRSMYMGHTPNTLFL